MHLRLLAICIALIVPLAPGHLTAGELPPFTARYSLHSHGIKLGEMTRSLELVDEGVYLFRSKTASTGLVSLMSREKRDERSRYRVDDAGLHPLLYEYERTGKKARKVSVKFDWTALEAINTYNEESWRMPIEAGTLDKLLYQVQMMRELNAGASSFDYTIADGGKTKHYHFDVLGEESIETALGRFDTIVLERVRKNSKKRTRIWCARDLQFLPVKVEHRDKKGKETIAKLQKLTGISVPPDSTAMQ